MIDPIRNRLRDFRQDVSGNVAMMTAGCMTMLLVVVGVAIDYTRAESYNRQLQDVADAAVLVGAASRDMTDEQVRAQVAQVIETYNTSGTPWTVEVVVDNERISVAVESDTRSLFGSMMAREKTPIRVVTAAPRAHLVPIHLAMVLDTTDSMQGDNLTAMQAAAKSLVDEMEDLKADVKMSVVPFGQYVNVGFDKTKKTFPSWVDKGKYGQPYQSCNKPWIVTKAETCTDLGTEEYDHIVDGRNMGRKTRPKKVCSGGEGYHGPEVCETKYHDWNGCIGSRANGLRERVDFGGSRMPAALDEPCGSEMMALSSDFAAMRDTIDDLTTKGPTYLPSGLMWGWRSLHRSAPYPEANLSGDKDVKRAMLFMTDGVNTRSVGDWGNDTKGVKHRNDQNEGKDGLTLAAKICEAVNTDNVEVFVVAYQMPGETATRKILEDCATSSQHFYTPDTAAELSETFADVAAALDSTRLEY